MLGRLWLLREQLVPEITTHALSYLDFPSLCRLSMTNSLMRKAGNDDNAWKALYHKLMYLAILGASYCFIIKSVFCYLPGYYLSDVHKYTSVFAVGMGLLLFILTSFSDPGTIKAENVSQYLSAYPYDNVIYGEKECPTCKLPKPARSKHCRVCNRCVARITV